MRKSNILAHRGLWKDSGFEKNSKEALFKALEMGFGIETDIRDGAFNLEIRHDPFKEGWDLEELLKEYHSKQYDSLLGLNIKSDGLGLSLIELLKKYDIKNYFTFDMSIPDHLMIDEAKIKSLVRISEYEKNRFLFRNSIGYWIDQIKRTDDLEKIFPIELIKKNYIYVFVSPELHNRSVDRRFISYLEKVKDLKYLDSIFICTDIPEFYAE